MALHDDNLALAIRYAAAGLGVFPVDGLKRPWVAHWKDDASTDPQQIRNWWSSRTNAGVGLPLEPCGLIVIDADRRGSLDGVSALQKLIDSETQWPEHPIADTPGGGEHHIFLNSAGLGNSAGAFKRLGIDIRGNGGYIVAPGTANHNGRWAARAGSPELIQAIQARTLPEVPDWVVNLIRQADKIEAAQATVLQFPAGPISVNTNRMDAIVRNALDRVATSAEGTRNENLNTAAFALGGLLHTGVLDIDQARRELYDAAVACGLVGHDGDRAVMATIESGLAAGQSRPFAPAERLVIQRQAPDFSLKWHGEPQELSRWLVKGLLPQRGVGLIAGQSGVGKSFIALDLAGALATGSPFFDQRIPEPGGTLFLLGEAEETMPERLEAICQGKLSAWHGADLPIAWTGIENLSAVEGAVVTLSKCASNIMQDRFEIPLRLIVVDTIAATFALQDENASAEATKAMKTLQRIAAQTQTCVIGIAHYGKSVEVGVRGSSAFTASADVILAATWKRTTTGQVTNRFLALDKSRRAETGWWAGFFLNKIRIGQDEDGDEITSCFVTGAPRATPVAANDNEKPRGRPPSKATTFFLEAMRIALKASGQNFRPDGMDSDVRAVGRRNILAEFTDRYPADGNTEAKRRQNISKQFKRGEESALAKKIVECRKRGGTYLLWFKDQDAEDDEAEAEG